MSTEAHHELRIMRYLFSRRVLRNLLFQKPPLHRLTLRLGVKLLLFETLNFGPLFRADTSHSLQIKFVVSVLGLGVITFDTKIKRGIWSPISISGPCDTSTANVLRMYFKCIQPNNRVCSCKPDSTTITGADFTAIIRPLLSRKGAPAPGLPYGLYLQFTSIKQCPQAHAFLLSATSFFPHLKLIIAKK